MSPTRLQIMNDPAASDTLKRWLAVSKGKDPCKVANWAETLHMVLDQEARDHAQAVLHSIKDYAEPCE
jgi:hypothetical protein